MEVVADIQQEENKNYSHLSRERRPRRNKSGKILKEEDLTEEKLHTYFVEKLQDEHQLPLVEIDWSFIAEFPVKKSGKAICPAFIDGLLYPEDASEGKTFKQFEDLLKRKFTGNGLAFRKMLQKKRQEYHKKSGIYHRPFFVKLDDYGYDFGEKRITELQQATQEL